MNPRLLDQLHMRCAAALRSKPEESTDAVVQAFGCVIWAAALGESRAVPRTTATKLSRLGKRAQLALGARGDAGADATDSNFDLDSVRHAARQVIELLRVGIQILETGEIATAATISIRTLHPPAATLARMLEGTADGLTAGRYGLHVIECARCQQVLTALPQAAQPTVAGSVLRDAPLKFAASPATRLRSPEGGVVVARRTKPAAEAVLFVDADANRLAVYAASDEALRLVAEGVTTEDARAGYWIGRLDTGLRELAATLHHAKSSVRWNVKLPGAPKPRKRKSR